MKATLTPSPKSWQKNEVVIAKSGFSDKILLILLALKIVQKLSFRLSRSDHKD